MELSGLNIYITLYMHPDMHPFVFAVQQVTFDLKS